MRSAIPARILAALETGQRRGHRDGDPAADRDARRGHAADLLTGLAVAISFRAGMFNIGVDGQLMIGALGATIAAFVLKGQAPVVR